MHSGPSIRLFPAVGRLREVLRALVLTLFESGAPTVIVVGDTGWRRSSQSIETEPPGTAGARAPPSTQNSCPCKEELSRAMDSCMPFQSGAPSSSARAIRTFCTSWETAACPPSPTKPSKSATPARNAPLEDHLCNQQTRTVAQTDRM
eukprot:Cvel_23325.t1-p1 / transcript=Cvel_23325.t1 / gene=Cvel_23325 / organism=Chromera_velia_CCMP2878 / gene_product=hypothetical protein / transcript_product=hypothetical protein / location=Cvel_scaffold2389:20309-23864(+) / protein_length=147 / sequence_SO=supercontig / SO=protein_coding / is_pseudo=false